MMWRAWYDDGSVYDSRTTTWADVPEHGLQVVMLYLDPPHRQIMQGEDEFRLPGEAAVRYGRWMDDASYQQIVDEALRDMRWP